MFVHEKSLLKIVIKAALSGSLILAALLVVISFTAQAEEMTSIEPVSEVYVNPLYSDEVTEEELESEILEYDDDYGIMLYADGDSEEEVEYLDTIDATAELFRQLLVERETSVTLYYQTSGSYSGLLKTLSAAAFAHTGVPYEGDYLKWQYKGWQGKITGFKRNGVVYLTVTYTLVYYTTYEQEEIVTEEVDQLLNQLDLYDANDFEKVRGIYEYICHTIKYDYSAETEDTKYLRHTAYAAIHTHVAVCQGYATLFYRLMLELGVDNRLIPGTTTGGNHAWNIVKLGGTYYDLDSTWDAGKSPDNYQYYLKGDNDFAGHIPMETSLPTGFFDTYQISDTNCEAVDAMGHCMIEKAIITEAGCEENGVSHGVCRVCGQEGDYETSALGHDWDMIVVKEPTHLETGIKQRGCLRCGELDPDYEEIIPIPSGTWKNTTRGWRYSYEDGAVAKQEEALIDGNYYRFNSNGYMVVGWYQKENGEWNYYSSSGAKCFGWKKISGTWYYLEPDTGTMLTGFQTIGQNTYYMKSSGAMVTGWNKIGGNWYRFDANGAEIKGWTLSFGLWYYMNPTTGKMMTGLQTIDQKIYYLNSDGAMVTGWKRIGGNWYRFSGSGSAIIGWTQSSGYWYYMKSNGVMATSEWVDSNRYYVDASGKWVR